MSTKFFHAALPAHGVPSFISEILSSPETYQSKTVRIVGRVHTLDPNSCIAELYDPGKTKPSTSNLLKVDISLTDEENFCHGSQVMVIGELEWLNSGLCSNPGGDAAGNNELVLKARVSRCVDRLDFSLYRQSVEVMRNMSP